MRINEDYLDDIEDFQDVLQQDEPLRQYGKWWVVQVKEYSQAAADTGKNDSFIPKFSK